MAEAKLTFTRYEVEGEVWFGVDISGYSRHVGDAFAHGGTWRFEANEGYYASAPELHAIAAFLEAREAAG